MKIIVQNLATEYQDEGAGKVMLFLHGWQNNLHSFDPISSLLSSTNRIVRLDLPGFGKSEAPKEAWDLNEYVKFVKNFIQKLNLQVHTLVGHSFGARIVIKGQATKNLNSNRNVLICAAGVAKKQEFRNLILKFFTKIGAWATYIPPLVFLRQKLRKKIYKLIGSDYLNSGALKETFLNIISEDLSASAKKIATPTILIWGEDDSETPLVNGEKLSRLIHNSKLKVISGAGHFVHQEKPQEVIKLIQEFL